MVSRSVECIYAQECDAGRKYGVSVVPPGCAGLVYFWGRNSSALLGSVTKEGEVVARFGSYEYSYLGL